MSHISGNATLEDPRAGTFGRSALAYQLSSSAQLAIISAPPGFGKSKLLAEAAKLASQTQLGGVRQFRGAEHAADPKAAAEAIRHAHGNELIIIEDVDHADRTAIAEALRLREGTADRPRVWLSLSHLKEVAVARNLAGGDAELFNWRRLRLADGEVKARLDRLPARFRKPVGELARGWPVASSILTAWALAADPAQSEWEAVDILADSGLGDFIEQEILPMLDSEELDALVHASIADQIDASAHPSGEPRAPRLNIILRLCQKLAGLIERNANILTIQPALRAFLSGRFDALPRDEQARTLEAVAADHARRGRLASAARMLHRAGLQNRIVELVLDHGSLLIWMEHGFQVIREIVEQAEEDAVAGSPTLQLMRCIVLMKTGRIAEAQKLFAAIAHRADDNALFQRDREIVHVMLLVYGCGLQRNDDLERFRAIVANSAVEPGWKSLMSTMSCVLNAQRARFDAAMVSLIDARVHARSAASTYNLMFLSLHEAGIHLAQGALAKARLSLGDARKRWRREYPEDLGAETVTAALTASLEYESGQVTSARASVRKSAYRMPNSEAWFDIYFAAYEPMARIIAADHGLGTALEGLQDQQRKLRAQGLPRVADLLQNLAIVLAGEAALTDGSNPGSPIPEPVPIAPTSAWQEIETFTLASAYVRAGCGDAGAALALLEDAIESAEQAKILRSALRYRLALIALLRVHGDAERADAELHLALQMGARLGSVQVFCHHLTDDQASAIRRFVADAGASRTRAAIFAKTVLRRVAPSAANAETPLSAREVEILSALGEGGSDKMLGRLLGMSEHGVRFHLKNIFRKLNVHDRTAAVHRARLIGAI